MHRLYSGDIRIPSITTVLLRNSDKHLISWLDLSKEHIGETSRANFGSHYYIADPLLLPQPVGAIHSRYVSGEGERVRTSDA